MKKKKQDKKEKANQASLLSTLSILYSPGYTTCRMDVDCVYI